jgi:hypothetical protein
MSSKIHPAVLQCVALAPVVWWFGKRLDDGCDEPLGLLTLALACVLAWRDRRSLHATSSARVFGAALVLLSVLGIQGLPPMLRAGLAVAGVATCYGIHRRAGLLGLFALSLPVVASMQFFAGYPLRLAAAEGTVRLLELGSVVVSRSGTQIELCGRGPEVFTFNGLVLPLHFLPPTEAETAFAKSFPGTLSSHCWGTDQVILRRVNQATRRLHPSGDCLRAAGFETTEAITVRLADGSRWARFSATRDGLRRTVYERITSSRDGSTWTDVSAWYWAALWHPLNGPWQAETVIGE